MTFRSSKINLLAAVVALMVANVYSQRADGANTESLYLVEDVLLVAEGSTHDDPTHTFVVTHGMGGTTSGDRFHSLARQLARRFPEANVWRIDWSALASRQWFGLPSPWLVASNIDPSATSAVERLRSVIVDPDETTLIGESFGNYVNYRVAEQLGGVEAILVLNPAHETGGYPPPDFRKVAARSIALVSASDFDTHRKITDRRVLLQTSEPLNAWQQHVYGVQWLAERLDRSDLSWALVQQSIPPTDEFHFDGVVLADGSLTGDQPPVPIRRPQPGRPVEPAAELASVGN